MAELAQGDKGGVGGSNQRLVAPSALAQPSANDPATSVPLTLPMETSVVEALQLPLALARMPELAQGGKGGVGGSNQRLVAPCALALPSADDPATSVPLTLPMETSVVEAL